MKIDQPSSRDLPSNINQVSILGANHVHQAQLEGQASPIGSVCNVLGTNNIPPSMTVTGTNIVSNTILSNSVTGINNNYITTSESSDFERFTSGDLKITEILRVNSSSTGSSPPASEGDFEYEDAVYDSSGTILAESINIDDTNNEDVYNERKPHSNDFAVDPNIMELWVKDAEVKKWTVLLYKLTNGDIYTLSRPAPDWSKIDPYSSLEERSKSEIEKPLQNTPAHKTRTHLKTSSNDKVSSISDPKTSQPKLHRSLRHLQRTVYCEHTETSNSDTDSDYEPTTKTPRNQNVGLKTPSSARLCAQEII